MYNEMGWEERRGRRRLDNMDLMHLETISQVFYLFIFLQFYIDSVCWVSIRSACKASTLQCSCILDWTLVFMFDVSWSLSSWNFLHWSEVAVGYLGSAHTSVGRISYISSGSSSFYALAETGVGIDLVGGLEFLLGANKHDYKKIREGLTFCCTHE